MSTNASIRLLTPFLYASLCNFRRCLRTKYGSGCKCLFGFSKHLFMSFPRNEQRWLPVTTPSGLIIGIIWNTTLFRKFLTVSEDPSRYSMMPWVIQLAFVSPGWTRLHINTIFRFCNASFELLKFVIIIKGMLRPPRLLPNSWISHIFGFFRLLLLSLSRIFSDIWNGLLLLLWITCSLTHLMYFHNIE